ncbi:MAG: leucine-rich repeat protein [Clostridium sp.]|nr:leucine-rich repeat protein [Clostridium sp.]
MRTRKKKVRWRLLAALLVAVLATGLVQGAAPERVQAAAASGTGWTLDEDGKLTIRSDAGMTDWCSKVSTYKEQVTTAEIQSGVKQIGSKAFDHCSNLTKITIADSVTSIEGFAFDHCSSLTEITIPDKVTNIGGYAFYYCSSLTEIEIPDGVTSISMLMFASCSSLTRITIPDSVTSIDEQAFSRCNSLEEIEIPDRVTSIGKNAFDFCESLRKVTLPSQLRTIEQYLFRECDNLAEITIPDNVTSIGQHAFDLCINLPEITIPDKVTSIGACAFSSCESLTKVVIPNSVTSIGISAFSGCSSLPAIVIPDQVTSIESQVFSGCSGLEKITMPDQVTSIGFGAFQDCSSLPEITIPAGVTVMSESVFENCSKLTGITIPAGVTSIGSSAFKNCSGLSGITIPDNVTSIGSSAFSGCSELTEVTIPDNVTRIGASAFENCAKLEKITILAKEPPEYTKDMMMLPWEEDRGICAGCPFVASGTKGILVPVGTAEAYKSADGWSIHQEHITDGTPEIVTQPEDQSVQNGGTASFSVTAEGLITPLTYQWQVNKTGAEEAGFENISGAVSTAYSLTADKACNGYRYRCVVTNERGSKESSAAQLTVTESHTHKVCAGSGCTDGSHSDIQWTAWSTEDSLPDRAGNWYLTADIQLTDEWRPADGTSLCLNGHTVTAAEGSKRVICISGGTTFNLCDCAETPGKLTKGYGGVENEGTFNMYGSEISGNSVGSGGGVSNRGILNLYGGRICNNTASTYRGGGVYNEASGTLNMYGGEIRDNKESSFVSGGGAGVYTDGIFNMYGGVICNNNSGQYTGGVQIGSGKMNVGGTAVIRDNTRDSRLSNVGFGNNSNTKISIDKENPLTDGAYISVDIFSTGEPFTEENESDYSMYFHTDNDWQIVVNGENNAVMMEEKHICYLTYHEATTPSCIAGGTGEYWKCEDIEEEGYGVVYEGCGKMYSDEDGTEEIGEIPTIPKVPHTYDDDSDMVCNICGYTRTVSHIHSVTETVDAKAADCTKDGNTAYYICSCGKWYSDSACTKEITDHDSVIISAKGHEESGQYETDETKHWKTCTVCHAELPKAIHEYDNADDSTCNVCGYERSVTPTHTHSVAETVDAKAADCTKDGNTAYYICSCGKWYSDSGCTQEITDHASITIPAKGHLFPEQWTVEKEAAESEPGRQYKLCQVCGIKIYQTIEPTGTPDDPDSPTPTPGTTDTPQTPTPTPGATDTPAVPTPTPGTTDTPQAPTETPEPDDSQQNGNDIGKRKDLSILLAAGKQSGSTGIKLTWLKWSGASGYEVYWSYCDGKSNYKKLKTVKATGKRTYTHKKLKKNRAYKYYIAAYKMVNGKKKYVAKSPAIHVAMKYEKRTNAKKITVNKAKAVLSLTNRKYKKTFQIKVKVKKENSKKNLLTHAAKLRYYTSDNKVAKVSKKGKITAVGKGKCTVYVIANNGVSKKITVTVK